MDNSQQLNVPGSFRDPSGFLFFNNGVLYRQINLAGKDDYDHFMNSGLYDLLVKNKWLIRHEESGSRDGAYKIIKPELINFISYPYEWCFSQLKDAALLTLEIQRKALEFGMSLRDASAYNIQFKDGHPILIDTLSFEKYEEGKSWVAYKQFCQHFLAPLALMAYKDVGLSQLMRIYIDGIPLDLASSLLPLITRFKFSLLSHIHLHAKMQNYFANKQIVSRKNTISKHGLLALINSLESSIKAMKWKPKGTEWADYYKFTNYSDSALSEKEKIVDDMIAEAKPKTVWDMGANTGLFSRLASRRGITTMSFDIDPAAVEKNYREARSKKEKNILPLLLDLTNPSPAMGWSNEERTSLISRGPADLAMALALVHHLAISNNLPLSHVADFFSKICANLIIEFIPKSDSRVQKLLKTREDIFPDYDQNNFEKEFSRLFEIKNKQNVSDSKRVLYSMIKK